MAIRQATDLLSHLHGLALRPDGASMSDDELLEQFLHRREDTAFAALVRRHGPMVLGVCRRVLHNEADAEDAFQATFLVLVRKAASIRPRNAVGNWLYGVAYRTAMKARTLLARRHARERGMSPSPQPVTFDEHDHTDLATVLDQELQRLPENYRSPLVLCELQGLSRTAAARQLNIPEGTLSSRLARGRVLLARRLTRRGVTLSLGTGAAWLAQSTASACPSNTLVMSTTQAGSAIAAGQATTSLVSADVATLTEGVIQTMFLDKFRSFSLVLLFTSFLVLGSMAILWQARAQDSPPVRKAKSAKDPRVVGAEPGKKDQQLLQGKWLPVLAMDNGVIQKETEHCTLTFAKDKMTMTRRGHVDEMRFQLNASKSPKWIDFTEKKRVYQGIYKLKGDTLWIVIDEQNRGRPTAFVSERGTPNDVLMIFTRARGVKNNAPKAQKAPIPPGAVDLQWNKELAFNARSNPITVNGTAFSLIKIARGTFDLSVDHHLTGKLKAGVLQYAKVDYWIHAAVFDRQGQLLGTASHKEKVQYVRLGLAPTLFRQIDLDFGISNAFGRAAYVVITIGDRDVPKPGINN